jgi:hypothetical protein
MELNYCLMKQTLLIDSYLTSNILLILLFVVDRTLLYMIMLYELCEVSVLIYNTYKVDPYFLYLMFASLTCTVSTSSVILVIPHANTARLPVPFLSSVLLFEWIRRYRIIITSTGPTHDTLPFSLGQPDTASSPSQSAIGSKGKEKKQMAIKRETMHCH